MLATNTLAYFIAASEEKKKKFCNLVSRFPGNYGVEKFLELFSGNFFIKLREVFDRYSNTHVFVSLDNIALLDPF